MINDKTINITAYQRKGKYKKQQNNQRRFEYWEIITKVLKQIWMNCKGTYFLLLRKLSRFSKQLFIYFAKILINSMSSWLINQINLSFKLSFETVGAFLTVNEIISSRSLQYKGHVIIKWNSSSTKRLEVVLQRTQYLFFYINISR